MDFSCFIHWQSNDVYAVLTLIRSGPLVFVPYWWPAYDCSRLLPVGTTIVLANYSKLVTNRRAPDLIFRISISRFFVSVLLSVLRSSFVGGPVCLISDFAG